MGRPRAVALASAGAFTAVLSAHACGDGGTEPSPPPDPPRATTLSVTPATAMLTAFGDTVQLRAEVRDQNGQVMAGAAVAWTSSDASVAAVDASGLVAAVSNGAATVTATAGSVSGSAAVTVAQVIRAVSVSPPADTLLVADTLRLTAEAQDARGNAIPGSVFAWASAGEDVAAVDSTGLVRALRPGDATITATSGGVTGSAIVTVAPIRIPPNFAVDEGTSHSLQFAGVHVSHGAITGRHPYWNPALAYADFNGDGHLDIFYSPLDGSVDPIPVETYVGDGRGGFVHVAGFFGSITPGGIHPRKALPGDFNGDGRPDIFVLGHGYDHPPFPGEAPYAILSSGSGYVLAAGLDGTIGFHHGGASADIDADGDLDVFVTENFKGPFFLLNDGGGSFTQDRTRIEGIGRNEGIFTAELVDVDRDGYVDLLAAGHEHEGFATRVLWGGGSGVFSTASATILPEVQGHGIVVDIDVADTDGDGDKDIILNRTGSPPNRYEGYFVQLLEHIGTRSFVDRTDQLFLDNQDGDADWVVWLRVSDIDEDGDPDVFADEESRQLVWRNDGTGKLQHDVFPPNPSVDDGTSHSLQSPPFRIDHAAVRAGRSGRAEAWAYGDFNGDGEVDVFYSPRQQSGVPLPAELYVGDANGAFSFAPGFMGGSAPALVSATKALPGDYNGDGRIDVFVTGNANWAGEPPFVVLSSDAGYVRGQRFEDLAGGNFGASADIDADGDLDIFLSDPPGFPRFLMNDGSGSFARGAFVEGLNTFILATELADVDRDGYADLVVGGHEHDGGRTRILWGDESGRYSVSKSSVLPGVPGYGVILDVDVGDIDADGDRDLVVNRTGDGTRGGFHRGYYVQLLENVDGRQFTDKTPSSIPLHRDDEAVIRWLRVTDVDADGDLDIVVDDYRWTDLIWRNDGAGRFRR